MKCTLHIYIVPSVDWYHHWRNRSSSFGGEANTNYYQSAKIICDERTDGHADYYMAALRGHNYTAHPHDMVHVPAKFRENTLMRFRVEQCEN